MVKHETDAAIDHFFERYVLAVRAQTRDLPQIEHDPALRSLCEIGRPDRHGMVRWKPLRRDAPADLAPLTVALGAPVHPDVAAWYSRWWSLPVEVTWDDDFVLPIIASAPEEHELRLKCAADYVLGCHRAARPAAVPVAVRPPGGTLVVRNSDGSVWIEARGESTSIVAPSLAALLTSFVPVPL